MNPCELTEECDFLKKYIGTNDLTIKAHINHYCMGPAVNSCMRKIMYKKSGKQPAEGLAPNGYFIISDL